MASQHLASKATDPSTLGKTDDQGQSNLPSVVIRYLLSQGYVKAAAQLEEELKGTYIFPAKIN